MTRRKPNNTYQPISSSALDNFHLSRVDYKATEKVKDYVRASSSEATLRAYKADLTHFMNWGGVVPATSELVAAYLADHAGELAVSTLTRRVAALSKIHQVKGFENPTRSELVRSTMRGIKRKHHVAPKQASPITKERLFKMLETCEGDAKGLRDRALLLVGFASALRRSELVALNVGDIEFVPEGLILNILRSKTDQQGEGRRIGIPYAKGDHCPVKSIQAYLEISQFDAGAIFRPLGNAGLSEERLADHGVAYIIKRRAKLAGYDPTTFSGHSLRAGFATSAAQSGAQAWEIMKQTGHKSEATVRKYIREGELFNVTAISNIL